MRRNDQMVRILAGAAALASAAWLAAQWTDRGDATCTALYRIDRTEYWFTGACRDVMLPRLLGVVVLSAITAALVVSAWRHRHRRAQRQLGAPRSTPTSSPSAHVDERRR
jgi:hypothetical protein